MTEKKKRRGRPPGSKNKKRGRPKGSGKSGNFAATLANINDLAKQLEKEMVKAIQALAKGVM